MNHILPGSDLRVEVTVFRILSIFMRTTVSCATPGIIEARGDGEAYREATLLTPLNGSARAKCFRATFLCATPTALMAVLLAFSR